MQAAVEAAEDLAEVADEKVLTLQELMACYIGMANRGEEFGCTAGQSPADSVPCGPCIMHARLQQSVLC